MRDNAKRWIVFLGPSLPRAEAAAILPAAEYLPPARMGDIYARLAVDLGGIVLIDGVFHGSPAIWPREIVEALDLGIQVIGASSMGALRAAELEACGMIGVGTIFGWYRDGVLNADDAVALLHGPEDAAWIPLSTPLVNLRATLAAAREAGDLPAELADSALDLATALHFGERGVPSLLRAAEADGWNGAERDQLRAALASHARDLKAEDARAALRRAASIRDLRPDVAHPVPVTRLPRWRRDRLLRGEIGGRQGADLAAELARDAERRRDAAVRHIARHALAAGVAPEDDAERRRAARLRASALDDALLRHVGVLRAEAERLIHDRLLLDAAGDAASIAGQWLVAEGFDAGDVDGLLDLSPDVLGLPWEVDVALIEEWQAARLERGL